MARAARHPILYDVERWRRYRTWLLLPATVFAMTALFTSLLRPTSGAAFGRPDRRRLLPRPTERWLGVEAISIRLSDGVDTRSLRRITGVRCVIDDLLVVPVADADGLLAELLEHVCAPRPLTASAAGRRRGRRR